MKVSLTLAIGRSDFKIRIRFFLSETVWSFETKVHVKAYGCCCCVPILLTTSPPPHTHLRTSAERIHGRGTGRRASVQESLWENKNELYTNELGHMTKMVAMPIMVKILNTLLLQNQWSNGLGTWYVASGTRVLARLFI